MIKARLFSNPLIGSISEARDPIADLWNSTVKWKVEPSSITLSTHMDPHMSSERFLLIESPSPVPPYLRVVDESTWLNDSKRIDAVFRDADASVLNGELRHYAIVLFLHLGNAYANTPLGGEFDGVANQVDDDLAGRPRARSLGPCL